MASLFKKTVTRYYDENGQRVTKNTPGSRKKSEKLKDWYAKYRDADGIERRVKLCTNKSAAQQMLAELVRKAEQERAGLLSPFEEHAKRPLTEHLAEFKKSLLDKGNTENHCHSVFYRASEIVKGCRFRFIGDLSASRVQSFLAEMKKSGSAQQTVNHYLRAIKQFARWLVKDRRTGDNRLTHLETGNVKTDLRIDRRELNAEELRWLLKTTRSSQSSRSRLSGEERFMLYSTALGTGLRASELASLTPNHFNLDADSPTVRIDAADEKARRGDELPLPPELLELLTQWLPTIKNGMKLWPGVWAAHRQGSKILKRDLEDARNAWIEDADTSTEREQREQSDFLCYRNHDNKQADFHALRHTFLSWLGRSGATAKVMQRLARRSTVELTLGRYTHAGLHDLAEAVDRLPTLSNTTSEDDDSCAADPEEEETGEDGENLVAPVVAPIGAKPCELLTTGEETETTGGGDSDFPQTLAPQQFEDNCGAVRSGETGILGCLNYKSLCPLWLQS